MKSGARAVAVLTQLPMCEGGQLPMRSNLPPATLLDDDLDSKGCLLAAIVMSDYAPELLR